MLKDSDEEDVNLAMMEKAHQYPENPANPADYGSAFTPLHSYRANFNQLIFEFVYYVQCIIFYY